jgi:hypothetical protein
MDLQETQVVSLDPLPLWSGVRQALGLCHRCEVENALS